MARLSQVWILSEIWRRLSRIFLAEDQQVIREEILKRNLSAFVANALNEMAQRAASAGANAVVGVDVDYEVLGADGNMLMVTVSGTAVVVE